MKSILSGIIGLSMILGLYSCNTAERGAKDRAQKFVEALDKFDIATAKKYATPESQEYLTLFGDYIAKYPEKKPPNKNVKILSCELNGDTGICKACCDYKDREFELHLVKMNDQWLVDFGKDTQRKPYEDSPPPPEKLGMKTDSTNAGDDSLGRDPNKKLPEPMSTKLRDTTLIELE